MSNLKEEYKIYLDKRNSPSQPSILKIPKQNTLNFVYTLWGYLQFSDNVIGQKFMSYIWAHMVVTMNNPYIRKDILHNINKHIIILKISCWWFYSVSYKITNFKCILQWLLYLFHRWTINMICEWPSNQPTNETQFCVPDRRNNCNIWEYFWSTEYCEYYTTHPHTVDQQTHSILLQKIHELPITIVLTKPLTPANQQWAVCHLQHCCRE